MKGSTKIMIPTLIVGNASMLYIVFSENLSQLISNNYIHNALLLFSIVGLLFTFIYNVFGGGLFNRNFMKHYIQEHREEKENEGSNPWS